MRKRRGIKILLIVALVLAAPVSFAIVRSKLRREAVRQALSIELTELDCRFAGGDVSAIIARGFVTYDPKRVRGLAAWFIPESIDVYSRGSFELVDNALISNETRIRSKRLTTLFVSAGSQWQKLCERNAAPWQATFHASADEGIAIHIDPQSSPNAAIRGRSLVILDIAEERLLWDNRVGAMQNLTAWWDRMRNCWQYRSLRPFWRQCQQVEIQFTTNIPPLKP